MDTKNTKDTKNIKINFECLVALSPEKWELVFDIVGSKMEELAIEAGELDSSGQRAFAENQQHNKAIAVIYGEIADYFFALRDHMEGVNHAP